MSRADLQDRASDLRTGRIPYVHARVVLAQRPTSAKPGDEAIIVADGSMEGFVGGSCAESTVRAQSLTLLVQLDRDGTRYYFCGPGCLAAFSTEKAESADRTRHADSSDPSDPVPHLPT